MSDAIAWICGAAAALGLCAAMAYGCKTEKDFAIECVKAGGEYTRGNGSQGGCIRRSR